MNSSSRNGASVVFLAVHTTEGIMRVQALRDWTGWPGSSHAASDETGALWGPEQGFVPYDRAAWTLRNANAYSENIEQCGWARWTRAEWLARPLLLDATARWLAERSKARGIPLRRLTAAEIRARVPGVLGHGDYSTATGDGTHWDPGPGYPWDVVLAKANAYANGPEDDMPSVDDLLNAPIPDRDKGPDATVTVREALAAAMRHAYRADVNGAQAVWNHGIEEAAKKGPDGKPLQTPAWVYLRAAAGLSEQAAQGVAKVAEAAAAQDPAALAAAIREQMSDDLVADVAARLTIAPK